MDGEVKKIPCQICLKPITESAMPTHIQENHPTAREYQCEKCNKVLRRKTTYKEHLKKACPFVPKIEDYDKIIADKDESAESSGGSSEYDLQDKSSDLDDETITSVVRQQYNVHYSKGENPITARSKDDGDDDDGDEEDDEEEDGDEEEEEKKQHEAKFRKGRKDLYDVKIPCDRCGKLICKSYMSEHISRLHSPKFYTCEKCGKSFRTELACNHHKMAKHSEMSPFECKDCKRKLSSRVSLKKHIARFHSSPDAEIYECEVCKKVFMLKEDLKQHLGCHNAEDSFVCTTCGKGFRKKNALQEHEHTHTFDETNKAFKCLHCDRRYKTKPSMKRHMLTHTEDKRFLCSICGKLYLRKPSLVKHMIVHTNDRPYKCDQCDKSYRSPNCLRAHKDTHTGFKRWKCIYCNKRFFNEANMYKHRKRHIRAYRHTCDICGKGFIEKQELTSHSKTHLVCK